MAKRGDHDKKAYLQQLSRRDFIKYSGISMLGAGTGIGSVGWSKGSSALLQEEEAFRYHAGIDKHGALITAAKIDPLLSYAGQYTINGQSPAPVEVEGVADLLAAYLASEAQGSPSQDIWNEITDRINYTYQALNPVLFPILGGLVDTKGGKGKVVLKKDGKEIQYHVKKEGKRLFFKPNLVMPEVLALGGTRKAPLNQWGCPGLGVQACTDWTFLAALMRWFHDNLEISYYQMAVGEASTTAAMYAKVYGAAFPFTFTPESVFEGRISNFDDPNGGPGTPIYYGGYPFFFVRKYLQYTHDPAHTDDPMQGHLHSQQGIYVPPGAATDLLPMYNLANAEATAPGARGRAISYPQGVQYREITVHKAIVGDPNDRANYPGCVLINVPKLKIHSVVSLTNAVKNLGIGLWPNDSGFDADPSTADLKYGMPSTVSAPGCTFYPVGNLKGRVHHSRQAHGLMFNCDGAPDPASVPTTLNDGIKGAMVDIDLAVTGLRGFVPVTLHVCDAIAVTNMAHGGAAAGVSKNEGLVFASKDPVALDLFCGRYLFKNVPKGTVPDHPFAMATPFSDVHYDTATRSIVSSGGFEYPIENDALYAYAERRGLGGQYYHVVGYDLTASGIEQALLATVQGHFGRLVFSGPPAPNQPFVFEEIITQPQTGVGLLPHYTSVDSIQWPLQLALKGYAVATDTLTLNTFGYTSGYESKYNAFDLDGDGRLAFADDASDADFVLGVSGVGYNWLSAGKSDRARFHLTIKQVKYADTAWNSLGAYKRTDATFAWVAMSLTMQPQSSSTVDRFFGSMVYGLSPDGIRKWPSLQWARYMFELNSLKSAYALAKGYATRKSYTFKLKVPSQLPYFPFASNPFLALQYGEIEQTTAKDEMFVATFYNTAGEEVERW